MLKMVLYCGEVSQLRILFMAFHRRSTPPTTSTSVPFVSLNTSIIHYFTRFTTVNDFSTHANDIEELINLHRGQGMDLYWRDSLTCPTEQEYIEMVNNKTGGLLRLAVKLMQACSPTEMSFQFSTILMVVIMFLL
jgi:geranylgeranyl diphosphate synthase, type III